MFVHLFSTPRLGFIYVSLENLVFSRPDWGPANYLQGGEIIRGWEIQRFHAIQVFNKGKLNCNWDTSGTFSVSVLAHNTRNLACGLIPKDLFMAQVLMKRRNFLLELLKEQ